MKNEIKKLRLTIDGLSQLTASIKPVSKTMIPEFPATGVKYPVVYYDSQETTNAYKSLLLSKAWLGKFMAELGEDSPYQNDGNRKTIEDIEPAADVFKKDLNKPLNSGINQYFSTTDGVNVLWTELTDIEKIDWLREEIKKTVGVSIGIIRRTANACNNILLLDYHTVILQHLSEARFWLGFELGRIRDKG